MHRSLHVHRQRREPKSFQCEGTVQSLTEQQHVVAKQTTLRDSLKTPSMNVRRVLCQEIASTYDAQADAFIIRGVPMRITLAEVEHISGLPTTGRDYVPPPFKDVQDLWLELKDPEDNKLTLKGLRKKMMGDESPRFVKPFVLYTIGKLVCPTTQPYVDPKFLGIVVNFHTINSINYAKLSLDHLMSSVRKFVNGAANLEGNLPLLQTWFYEKFQVDHIDRTISYLQRDKPLIQYWNEAKAGKVDKIISENYVGVGEMVEDLMRPWKALPKVSHQPSKSTVELDGTLGRLVAQMAEMKAIISQQHSETSAQMDGIIRRQKETGMRLEDLISQFNDHRFGVRHNDRPNFYGPSNDFDAGKRVDKEIKKTSKNVAASTNEVPKYVYSNPSKNLATEFEKVKQTSVDPQKGKIDRDDAVESIGRRGRRDDSKNLPA